MRLRLSVAASRIRSPLWRRNKTNARKRIRFVLSGYKAQAFKMLATSSLVNGAVGGSVIFGGFRGVVGFVGIQPLSCTKRKNARNASSFFRAAIFLFGQDARNRRTESTSKSVMCE